MIWSLLGQFQWRGKMGLFMYTQNKTLCDLKRLLKMTRIFISLSCLTCSILGTEKENGANLKGCAQQSFISLFYLKYKECGHSVVSNSLWPHGLYSPWNSPGQNTGVGSLSLLQGIFLTQGSNPGLLHCRWILYQLSYKVSPKYKE